MKKAFKSALACLLTLCLLVTPFSGVLVFAQGGPTIRFSITPLEYVTPDTAITVTYRANGDATLASCDTRLEGVSLGTAETVTFTPADHKLTNGVYTLVGEATDSNGATTIETLSFVVTNQIDINFSYAEDESIVPSVDGATATYHAVTPLEYTMGYGTTANGKVALEDILTYDALTAYNMQYMNAAVENHSTSGIPYQTFDVALNGKTDGEIVVRYSGSTLFGERIAVKVYNPTTAAWDTLGTLTNSGSVSASVDVVTYADNDVIHVMAILDYVTNGSDTMIWSTDPQHYTKFDDLNDYYYQIYQYAAEEYLAGNVGYIMTTGDIVDDLPSTTAAVKQWEVADRAMSYVDEVGMPNGLVSGNHDVKTVKIPNYENGDADVDYSKYLQYFSADRYNDQPWYGGSLNNNISHYDLITIGNVDFIIMYLGYGVEATDETIAWANDVLQRYSHRTAIITTHQYLDAATADRAAASRAQLIFDTIIDPNPNVKAILCGHDDGSIVNEVIASDGRTVYELLSDYQFVEAEDPDFYANEHYIGSVPSCCGDGYIRLMTVEGSTLSSITYSPVTGKYNPYGDRENISIDLNCGVPNRALTTNAFSTYILGEEISVEETWTTPSAIVITKQGGNAEEDVPASVNDPATPDAPYYAHAASEAPNVAYKTDLLKAAGLSDNAVNTGWVPYQNLNLNVDLTKTPYLYYSIDVPEDGNFTFALVNNTNYAPWLVFRDATGEGAYLNNGNGNWDSYQNREQYITASETGCVDMRTISTDPNKATWIVTQLTFYNSQAKGVTVNYMFFGSEPIEQEAPAGPSDMTTYHHTLYTSYPNTPEAGTNTPVDLAALEELIAYAEALDLSVYTEQSVEYLEIVLGDVKAIDMTDASEVSTAYFLLTRMLGAMKTPVEVIDDSNLVSIHNYDMTPSKWATADTIITALDGTGFKLSRNTKNGWASVNISDKFDIKANNGKIYIKLDVDADCAWSIHLAVSQANSSGNIVINHAVDNAFNRIDCDSMNGVYTGVYDITEAFTKFGMDPSATINVTKTYLYLVPGDGSPQYTDLATNPDTVDYRYVELLTEPATAEELDKSALQTLVDEVNALDGSLYTTATWNTVQQAMTDANRALNSTLADLTQADFNLVTLKLRNAVAKLKLLADVIEEPEGSLLPADESKWVPSPANTMNIYRNDQKVTVFENTNNQWPSATYSFPTPLTYSVADHQIVVDLDVTSQGRIDLLINNTSVTINKYITNKLDSGSGDMLSGTFTANIPLSDIITDSDTAVIKASTIFAIGASAASAVTVRKLQVIDYVAPPPVEDVRLDLIPENDEDWTLVAGEGTVTVENGVLTAVNNGDGDLRITLNKKDFFDLTTLNSLHLQFDTEVSFKMAFNVVNSNDPSNGAWPNTSDTFGHLFEITNDRAAAGEYDIQLELRDNCANITDKSSVYFNQFIILLTGAGTFTLNIAEMVAYDHYEWPEEGITYGDPATPDNPFYAHAAKTPPEVAEKYDLLKAIDYPTHPSISAWTKIGDQATDLLGLEIDISKTPYLYYSFAVPEDGNFTFAMYGNSNYCPWLSFLDSTTDVPFINQGAANWDAYTQREQYATTSQTGCIDMRPLLKNPAVLKWVITQINFYNSTGKNVILSYFFFGSEPISTEHVHDVIHFDAVEPGCHYIGNIEYWFCPDCEGFWQDEALTQVTNSKNVILPATGEGNLVHFDAVEPGCHYIGNIEYWYCADCEQFWQDEALTQLTNAKRVILPAVGSENLIHVEAVAPTTTENGNVEYWYCPDCDGYWLNEECTLLTTRLSVILPAVETVIGDIDGNGTADLLDATRLFYYVNGKDELTDEEMVIADSNADGLINLYDAARLFYYINDLIEEL